MVEEFRYQDKKVGKDEKDKGSLKNLVNEKFKKIDNKNGVERDDKEIYKAGQLVINQIINEIKSDNSIIRGEWALAPLLGSKETGEKGLIKELQEKINNLKGYNMLTNNADKINWVAQKIDNAENEALKRLAKNRTTQDSRNLVAKSNETYKGKPMFVMEGGNDVKKQTGNIIFTEAANPVKIHEALKGLFNNPNIVYEIDYSGCDTSTPKGKAIKEKMTNLIGTQTCYLRYDSNQKTYTIRDKNGIGISDRAYIRQGVKLIPAGVRKWQSYAKDKKEKENLGKFDDSKLDELTNSMLKDMPSAKELEPEEQKALAEKTENRIIELLKKAKKLGYEIDPECITTKWIGNGHMELHLNSGTSEVSRTIRGNDGDYNKVLGEKLDKFVDNNEGEYKTYLTKRVKAKWQELDKLTKTETSNISKKGGKDGRENLDQKEREKKEQEAETHKQQVLYGIGLLEKMVDNYRETEGDSWLDSDDKNLVQIKQLIRNAKSSINESDVLDDDAIIKNFVDPIRDKWASVKNVDTKYKPQRDNIMKVFFGTKEEQISAIRSLGGRNRIFDNTETSFLAEEIEGNDNLSIENADIQKCLDNINNRTSMSIYDANGKINEKVKGRYDNTYESAKSGTNSLITLFVGRGWLPSNWEDEKDEVIKCMDRLRDQLISINSQVNNISLSTESMIKENHEKRIKLEQKTNKTEEDMKILQGLTYLEENSDEAKDIYKDIIETTNMQLKYGNLGQVVRGGLLGALGKLGGGIKGKNADIYNDIKGLGGAFDFTDENAALTGEILTEIAITVAVAWATGGMGLGLIAKGLNIGAKTAKGFNLLRVANNISKTVRLLNAYKKAGTIRNTVRIIKTANKVEKITLGTAITSGLLLEGTAFNAASNMIHSAMNGTSLDNLNLNPIARENIQTAAFLGALSIGNKLGMGVITKLHGKTKIEAFSKAGLRDILKNYKGVWTESLISEATAMFGAEQGLNFVLGHDIIDPETGEVVTSHLPTLPTQQELIQMIGMILAFKVAKPGLWAKYEQKLNDGTLQICRSTKKNEILIRDAKTGEVEKIQDIIDGKESNGKSEQNRRAKDDVKTKERIKTKDERTRQSNEKARQNEKKDDNDIKEQQELLKRKEEITEKKETQEKKKIELERKKSELERKRNELLGQRESNRRSLDTQGNNIQELAKILKEGNIITIDGLKYKYNGIKNGKAEFVIEGNAKKSAEASGKTYSEKIEVSSLEEFLDSHFNLEPGNKGTNSGRYNKLNELIGEKIEPLDRLQNKIKNKKAEIKTLEEEIARLERGRNTVAKNDYFEQHKNEIIGKNVRIDGVKHSAEHVNTDGSIQFKEADGKGNFTVSSFKQLAEKGQVNGFSDGLKRTYDGKEIKRENIEGSESLTKSEKENHELIRKLIFGEREYLDSRNVQETINQKKSDLQKAQQELKGLEDKLPTSQAKQQAIDERAKKGVEINKELGKLETELEGINRDLGEADRLVKKYQGEIDGIKIEGKNITDLTTNREILSKTKNGEQGVNTRIKEEEIKQLEEQEMKDNNIKDTDSPQEIADKLENSIGNNTNFEVGKEAFVSGKFIEGIKNRFNKIIQRPNVSLPRESVKRLSGKIKEMMDKWGNKLSDNYRNLTERFSRYLNDLLKQTGEKIKIKEQQRMERKEQQRRQREEQQRREREEQQRREREEQGRQTEEGDDIIEAVEITGYQENIETVDGGRFTGEIKEGELYKGKFTDKNGNEWYIDKSSEHPVLKYHDKVLLDKIGNKESINVGELKRTHRTNFDVLKQIIDSGVIGNEGPRGVQFWGGLGACYGEVAVIMKNSVMNLPPAPSNKSKGHGNYDYFFSELTKNRDWSTFQKNASDFSFHRQARGENPNIDVPYLSIGGRNSNGDFAHEVGIEHIEAVMLPAHAKKYPGYSELVKRINEKGIKVIEAPTEENILDYAGGSIILATDGIRGSFDEAIIQELSKRYPHIPNFEQQAITYLIETGRISEREIRGKSFTEIKEDYIKMATMNGFSRGGTRGGQYQNYSSQKNYTREQQAYFKYIIESRATRESYNYPNPQIKAEIVDEAA